jgi:hypothetical protein
MTKKKMAKLYKYILIDEKLKTGKGGKKQS